MSKKFTRSTRSISKAHLSVRDGDLNSSVNFEVALFPAPTQNVTFVGGLIQLSIFGISTGNARAMFAIVLKRDTQSVNQLKLDHGDANLGLPEEDVIWHMPLEQDGLNTNGLKFHMQTNDRLKTKRKVKAGDQLVFLARANTAGQLGFFGTITSFFLT